MSVSAAQVEKAVLALLSYIVKKQQEKQDENEVKDLFEDDKEISLVFSMKKTSNKDRVKPIKIPLEHTIYGRDGVEICLFTKDPQTSFSEMLERNPVKNVTRVISISKLRTNYHQYKDRRELLSQYSLFLADNRIIPLLPNLLGVKFFDKKKQPVAVDMRQGSQIPRELSKARDSTYLFLSGSCSLVKIAVSGMKKDEIIANALKVIQEVVQRIPKKWANIQSIHLKTHDSVALPIFSSLPVQKIKPVAGTKDVKKEQEEEEEVKAPTPKKQKKAAKAEENESTANSSNSNHKNDNSNKTKQEVKTPRQTKQSAPNTPKAQPKQQQEQNNKKKDEPKQQEQKEQKPKPKSNQTKPKQEEKVQSQQPVAEQQPKQEKKQQQQKVQQQQQPPQKQQQQSKQQPKQEEKQQKQQQQQPKQQQQQQQQQQQTNGKRKASASPSPANNQQDSTSPKKKPKKNNKQQQA